MADYFVGTLKECQDYIVKMDTAMGYPNPATKTVTYANVIEHKGKAGDHLVIVKEVYSPKGKKQFKVDDIDKASTVAEKSKRKTEDVLKGEGAFPVPSLGVTSAPNL